MGNNLVGTYDIVVCGGTLGIFLATALCAKGLRVAVVERNAIKGVQLLVNVVVEVCLDKLLLKLFGFVVTLERTRMEYLKKRDERAD